MKGKRVISALCGFAMLLTGFGLTSSTAVADDGKSDQQIATQDVGGGDNQKEDGSKDAQDATSDSKNNSQEGSSTKDEKTNTEDQGITSFKTDTGQAAPDVTIHDMLDTDSASVSKLKLTDRVTGTGRRPR